MKKPTKTKMSDIAAAVGVSQATVSLVLNEAPGPRVSAATRVRVLEAAAVLGYRKPVGAARSGRVIGLVIDALTTSQHVATLLEGARSAALENDCVLAVVATGGNRQSEEAAIDFLLSKPVVGIVYATLITQTVTPPLRLEGVPSVFLNCHSPRNNFPAVVPADVLGGYHATVALLDAGHRRVGMINGEDWFEASRDRLKGYKEALTAFDVPFDPSLVVSGGWTFGSGRAQASHLLGLPSPPTALFCYCDRVALGAYDAVRTFGLRIPLDVSVVGFDDEIFATDMDPPLTTVVLPHEAMGRLAVEKLLDSLAGGPKGPIRRTKVECSLVERNSIAPPRNDKRSPPLERSRFEHRE